MIEGRAGNFLHLTLAFLSRPIQGQFLFSLTL